MQVSETATTEKIYRLSNWLSPQLGDVLPRAYIESSGLFKGMIWLFVSARDIGSGRAGRFEATKPRISIYTYINIIGMDVS